MECRVVASCIELVQMLSQSDSRRLAGEWQLFSTDRHTLGDHNSPKRNKISMGVQTDCN